MNRYLPQLLTIILVLGFSSWSPASPLLPASSFEGMWTLSIEGGKVGWLEVHDKEGFLDANLMWIGGSVMPVSHVYHTDENNLVVTRTRDVKRDNSERVHTITYRLEVSKAGKEKVKGTFIAPRGDGLGEQKMSFTGVKLPPVPAAPNLSKVKYGKKIKLFNGKNLKGWTMVDPESKNGFKVNKKMLINDPIQEEGHHVNYGNLRTEQEFEDFNLTLEVNVPTGNNSGVYLRGMYEIQVNDSYGKKLDSHHMGAVYSRVTPLVAAEKPGGEWQSLDITLCQRHITVILNGTKIVDNAPVHGPTGGAIIADVFAPGPIYLQGDHGKVSYRNIVLRPIVK